MPTVNLGRVQPIHRGAYNPATNYVPLDIVTYAGLTYFCIAPTVGSAPPNVDFWSLVADVPEVTTTPTDVTPGRLLKVGDFGLGETALPNSIFADVFSNNFNTIVRVSGVFSLSGAGITNGPPIGTPTGVLRQEVYAVSAGSERIHQFFYRSNTPSPRAYDIWYRYYQGGNWSAWARMFDQGNIVGAVTQSGGNPTGAAFEDGSNANGSFTKFADGRLLCVRDCAVDHNSTGRQAFSWPHGFSSSHPIGASVSFADTTVVSRMNIYSNCSVGATGSNAVFFIGTGGTEAATRTHTITGVGRWF